MRNNNSTIQQFSNQVLPLFLTAITCLGLILLLLSFIYVLNLFPLADKIILQLRIADILVGLTIYLKTSVDFALFIGNLMSKYTGVKNRIAIEIGTAVGNALGTIFVLTIWTFFKEVPILMIIMILLASLVLFTLAEEGLEEFVTLHPKTLFAKLLYLLKRFNRLFSPVLKFIIPHATTDTKLHKTFLSLLLFSLSIPLILGLDDFAGYIPLFNIVNVFGFAVGVFVGHMILNLALFASPRITIKIVKQPVIALLGSFAFIGIALWGVCEAIKILQTL